MVIFGKLAEVVESYVKKGSLIYLEGKLATRKWQDKDGNDRYNTEITAHTMTMLGGKTDGGGEQRDFGSKQADTSEGGTPKQVSDDAPFDDEIHF